MNTDTINDTENASAKGVASSDLLDVWFSRDADGEACTWEEKPDYKDTLHGKWWDITPRMDRKTFPISDGTDMTKDFFGDSFYGVEKGECKRVTVQAAKDLPLLKIPSNTQDQAQR